MGKRIGANGRKKQAQRRGKRKKNFVHFLSTGFLYAALFVTGTALIVYYKEKLPGFIAMMDSFGHTTVKSVVMEGAVHVTPEEMLRRSGMKLPITVDRLKREYLDVLSKTSPWIDKVHLMTSHKGTVTLGVVERKPVAMVRMVPTAKIALIDAAGVYVPLDPHAALDLPLVSGLADSAAEGGVRRLTAGDCARMNRFLGEAARLDSAFARRITQISFSPDRTVRIMLTGSPTAIVLDENTMAERLQRLMLVWETVGGDSLHPARINLSYRNLAFVTMETAVPDTAKARIVVRQVAKGKTGKKHKG
jgi:cell division septal protein FtsQ